MTKLHLGCGKRNFPGFINVDLADYPHIHHRRNVDDLSIFGNDSVDQIYASHVLEYFSLKDVGRVLSEWRRVLKPGGILKIAVPDFNALCLAYQRYGRVLDVQGLIYGFMELADAPQGILFHKVLYDFELLKQVLKENSFINIKRYDWRGFLPEGIEDHSTAYIPRRDFNNGILVSLNVEAERGGTIRSAITVSRYAVNKFAHRALNKLKKTLRNK